MSSKKLDLIRKASEVNSIILEKTKQKESTKKESTNVAKVESPQVFTRDEEIFSGNNQPSKINSLIEKLNKDKSNNFSIEKPVIKQNKDKTIEDIVKISNDTSYRKDKIKESKLPEAIKRAMEKPINIELDSPINLDKDLIESNLKLMGLSDKNKQLIKENNIIPQSPSVDYGLILELCKMAFREILEENNKKDLIKESTTNTNKKSDVVIDIGKYLLVGKFDIHKKNT